MVSRTVLKIKRLFAIVSNLEYYYWIYWMCGQSCVKPNREIQMCSLRGRLGVTTMFLIFFNPYFDLLATKDKP